MTRRGVLTEQKMIYLWLHHHLYHILWSVAPGNTMPQVLGSQLFPFLRPHLPKIYYHLLRCPQVLRHRALCHHHRLHDYRMQTQRSRMGTRMNKTEPTLSWRWAANYWLVREVCTRYLNQISQERSKRHQVFLQFHSYPPQLDHYPCSCAKNQSLPFKMKLISILQPTNRILNHKRCIHMITVKYQQVLARLSNTWPLPEHLSALMRLEGNHSAA